MRSALLLGSALAAVSLLSNRGLADDDTGKPTKVAKSAQVEQVTVSANKRPENLQKVAVSAAVLTGRQLEQLGVTSTTAIADHVAGVQVMTINSGSDNFFSIRGVTQDDFAEHEESPVSVYLDGVYFSQAGGTAGLLFDTSRVEVLRGPQGTLFGRNATGGVVEYFSRPPTDTPGGYVETSYGSYNSNHTEAAYGTGLGGGFSVRVSLANDYSDPYLTNTDSNGHDAGGQNAHAGRVQLRYDSQDGRFDATLNLHGSYSKVVGGFYKYLNVYADPNNHDLSTLVPGNENIFGTCTGCNSLGYKEAPGTGYYTGASNVTGHDWLETEGATETMNYRFDGLTLTSITDITHFRKDYLEDSDATPDNIASFWTNVNTPQFSQEVHLSNGGDKRLRWVAGLYFLQIDGHYLEGAGYGPTVGAPTLVENYAIRSKSWSEFGQVDYDVLKDVTLTAGGRWTTDERQLNLGIRQLTCDYQGCPVDTTVAPFEIDPQTAGSDAKYAKSDWSGKVALSWRVTSHLMPYVSFSKGIKAGGFNAPDGEYADTGLYKFNEEQLYSTEAGVKSSLFGNRVTLDADGFNYDYNNYQATNTLNNNTYVTNQPAHIYGGELEAVLRPIPDLDIHQGLALLNATVKGITLPDGSVADRQAVQAPHVSYTGGVDYRLEMKSGAETDLGADYSYRSAQFFQLTNDPADREGGYWLANLYAIYRTPNGLWSVRGSVNNVFGQHYLTNIFAAGSINLGQGVYGQPREFAVQLKRNF